MRRIIAKIMNFIGILLMLIVILVMVPFTIPKLFGYEICGVLTDSMTPAYPVGSVLFIDKCGIDEIAVGDVVTYKLGTGTDYVMSHRVVDIEEEDGTFRTRGDANNTEDPEPIRNDRLIGKVVFSVPGLGRVADFMQTSTGKAVCFIVFAVSFILWLMADLLAHGGKRGAADSAVKPDGAADGKTAGRKGPDMMRWCILAVGIVLIVGSAVYLGSILLEYHKGTSEYNALKKQVFADAGEDAQAQGSQPSDGTDGVSGEAGPDAESIAVCRAVERLAEENEDVVGWIEFDNVDISYPIMQGEDNDEYLYHTYSKEYNSSGSIFMEALNNPDFQESHTIIYGHNMKNGSMFGKLKKYKTEDFYDMNQYFTIYTADKVMRYQIFAYYDISQYGDVYDIYFDSAEELGQLISNMQKRSYINTKIPVGTADKIVTLSTCSTEDNRFVVNAKRVSEMDVPAR